MPPQLEIDSILSKVVTKEVASPALYKLCFPDRVVVEGYKRRTAAEKAAASPPAPAALSAAAPAMATPKQQFSAAI
jgi:hypothetical protein